MILSNIKKFCTLVTKTSFDEIQDFKNLRPPVPEELILFNVFFLSFSDECIEFFNI